MEQPDLLEIQQAAPPGPHVATNRLVEPGKFAAYAAECPDQRHVADDVDHLAVDGGGLVGIVVMERLAGGGETEHGEY